MIRNKGLVAKVRPCAGIASRTDQPSGCCGIYVTNTIVQDLLINEALENEATHFWSLYEQNPNKHCQIPTTCWVILAVDEDMQGVPEQYRSYGRRLLRAGSRGRFGTDFVCARRINRACI